MRPMTGSCTTTVCLPARAKRAKHPGEGVCVACVSRVCRVCILMRVWKGMRRCGQHTCDAGKQREWGPRGRGKWQRGDFFFGASARFCSQRLKMHGIVTDVEVYSYVIRMVCMHASIPQVQEPRLA